jgi:hypothetical protein
MATVDLFVDADTNEYIEKDAFELGDEKYLTADLEPTPIVDVPKPTVRMKEEKMEIFTKFQKKYGVDGHRNIADLNNVIDNSEENYVTTYGIRRDDLLAEFILHAFKVGYTVDEFWQLVDKNTGYADFVTKELCYFPKRVDLFKLFLETKRYNDIRIPVSSRKESTTIPIEGWSEIQSYEAAGSKFFDPEIYEKEQTFLTNRNLVEQYQIETSRFVQITPKDKPAPVPAGITMVCLGDKFSNSLTVLLENLISDFDVLIRYLRTIVRKSNVPVSKRITSNHVVV